MKRKGMGDLKKDIANTANTSKEIVRNIYCDAKAEAQKAAYTVDGLKQSVVAKSKNAADDIKKGAKDVGQDVKQTAENISRRVSAPKPPHQTEKTNRKQS